MFAPLLLMRVIAAAAAGSSGNNNLSALAISVGSLSPGFASGTTSYADNVVNGVTQISVTPTAAVPVGTVITVNGQVVPSGSASGNVNLAVGANAITIVVDGGSGTKTYTVTVTRAAAANNSAPNPVNPSFVWAYAGGNLGVVVTNPNATAMTISFSAWQITSPNNPPPGKFTWVTAFPLTIAAGDSVNLTANATLGSRLSPYNGFSPGTWACGTDSGTMEAGGRQNTS